MLGAAIWSGLHGVAPHMPLTPEPFVVIGMMALFGGVAHAPLAVMFMVGEMAGSYNMLAPAMIAVGISYAIVGRNTIYESQVESPAKSPAHRYEYFQPLLARLRVRDAMRSDIAPVTTEDSLEQVEIHLVSHNARAVPVVDYQSGELVGIVSRPDIIRLHGRDGVKVKNFMSTEVVSVTPDDSLDTVMELFSRPEVSSLPVLEKTATGTKVVGMIARADVARVYSSTSRRLLTKGVVG